MKGMEKYSFPPQEQKLLEGLQQAYAVYQFIDKRVVTLVLSDGFCRLFGYEDRAQAMYEMDHDMYRNTHPDDAARIANAAIQFATDGGEYDTIYRTRIPGTNDYRVVHAHGVHALTDTGIRLAHIWYTDEGRYMDETKAGRELSRMLNEALHEQSFLKASRYDYLTGLPSMTYFFELAEAGKKKIRENGDWPVLLFIDINGMKFFNQKHGFAEGDRYLQDFSRILVQLFSNENCCRFGQDHFGVFSRETGVEEKLNRLFEEARSIKNGAALTIRTGIYRPATLDVPVSTACDRAKLACDSLRKVFTSSFCYYSNEMREEALRKQYILENFDRALQEKWIRAYYQPIVRAVNERVCDEEALARWIDPEKGFLSPAEFIPCLEEAGQLYKLDLYILDQVLQKIKDQQKTGLYIVPQSINLSRSDFDSCDIAEEIRKRVDAAGIGRDKITVEITESVIGSDFEFMKQQVERFQQMGFAVWMDDFGSGYSSLDVLQSIQFDLIKFDMSFMRKLDEGDSGKIILTELMKMATSLGVDTVCEGVETEEQARFLQEIGCSKLQGFYFCKPIPMEEIIARYEKGIQIGFENPAASAYYEAVGRINLYDLAVIAGEDGDSFQNAFNTLPMGIIEVRDGGARFVRSNPTYRDFIKRFIGHDVNASNHEFGKFGSGFMSNIVKSCCETGTRTFYDERMPDGSIVRSFARRIGIKPVTGSIAIAVAVLSVSKTENGADYAEIARALAADYYNIYVVDLDTEDYISYTSPVGREELAEEGAGTGFFASARADTMTRIYEEDRALFLSLFTKENILKELDKQGVFTITYRLTDTGKPVYANMKVTRMPGENRIILGVSIVDSQMKQMAQIEEIRKERDTLAKMMALNGDYLSLYSIHPETGQYVEYTSSEDFETLGLDKTGSDFFRESLINIRNSIHPEDLPLFMEKFNREQIMKEIRENGAFILQYRLILKGEPRKVVLKIASLRDGDETKLVAGVRTWGERR